MRSLVVLGLAGLTLLSQPAFAVVDAHTVALWLFDEGSGDTVRDWSGNGHDAKVTGDLSWVSTPNGRGIDFPGDASGYLVVESTDKLLLNEQLTIELRVEVHAATGKWQGILAKQQAGCTNRNYGIWVHQTKHVFHAEIGSGGGCDYSIDGTTVITDDQWHYLAFTYDGKVGRLYVDGVLEAESPYAKEPFKSDDPITIGVPNLDNANGLLGVIDEMRISDIARSEQEIREAMDVGLSTLLAVNPQQKLPLIWASLRQP